jgi:predicted small secreted protein
MKNTIRIAAIVAAVSLMLPGCSFVTSAQGGDSTVTGEAWYARTGFFGGTKIFYCPADQNVCYKADFQMNGGGEARPSRSLD